MAGGWYLSLAYATIGQMSNGNNSSMLTIWGLVHQDPCQQGGLYCAAQDRFRACSPKGCSWLESGTVLLLLWQQGQISHLPQALVPHGRWEMGLGLLYSLLWGLAYSHLHQLCFSGQVQGLFSKLLQLVIRDSSPTLMMTRPALPPASGISGGDQLSPTHVAIWQMKSGVMSPTIMIWGLAHLCILSIWPTLLYLLSCVLSSLVKESAPLLSLLTLIVPFLLMLQGAMWAWIFCLGPRADSPRPECGFPCPLSALWCCTGPCFFLFHKEIIIVPNHPAPMAPVGSWLAHLAYFLSPHITTW